MTTTTQVAWYPRSAADGDTHRGVRRPTGRVTALCGAEYAPAAGPDAYPVEARECPTCRRVIDSMAGSAR